MAFAPQIRCRRSTIIIALVFCLSCLSFATAASPENTGWDEVVPPWLASPTERARGMTTVEETPRPTNWQSQFGEDQLLWDNVFFRQRGGTFLEMGALDGVRWSNTFALDKDLGWRGVLIEGDPVSFKGLKANRPGHVLVNSAVCRERRVVHYVRGAKGDTGGIVEFMSEDFKKKFHKKKSRESNVFGTEVMCVPLVDILSKYGITHFNLWSLDVEGAEYEVLQTMDFTRFTFDVLVVEAHALQDRNERQRVWQLINSTQLFDFRGHFRANDLWVAKAYNPHKNSSSTGLGSSISGRKKMQGREVQVPRYCHRLVKAMGAILKGTTPQLPEAASNGHHTTAAGGDKGSQNGARELAKCRRLLARSQSRGLLGGRGKGKFGMRKSSGKEGQGGGEGRGGGGERRLGVEGQGKGSAPPPSPVGGASDEALNHA